jgi:hypothetical protein
VVTGESSSPWQQLQDLVGDAARIQARWAKAVVTTAQAAGRGEGPSARDLLQNVGSEYQSYLRDLGKLNLEYARALQDLTAATGERFTEAVEDAARPRRQGGHRRTPAAPTTRVSLTLAGTVGGTASGTVTVANTRDRPADLSFMAGPLVDISMPDAPGLQPSFTFNPGTVRLEPGAESTIGVLLPLDADRFTAGHEYHGKITVLGGDGTQLDVTLRAVAGPPSKPTTSATSETATRKTARGGTAKTTALKKTAARKTAARKTAAKKATAKRPARARRTPPAPG